MVDFLITDVVHVAILSLGVIGLKHRGLVEVRLGWALASLILLIGYTLALSTGNNVVPVKRIFPDASWNWGGKILAVVLWMAVLLLLVRAKEGFSPAEAGFTLKQHAASFRPAMIALGLFALLQILVVHAWGGSDGHDKEELLFQALMPGIDEEPIYRGLLLYLLSMAIPSQRTMVFGAQVNVAGLILVVLFGLGHGLRCYGGEWYFSGLSISLTGLYGFILLWFRERTGSLVFPVIAHNTVNVVGQFV